jgi:hypothetical protein
MIETLRSGLQTPSRLRAIERIHRYVEGMTEVDFLDDEKLRMP